jgi:23S rRNA (cytosine1962-C5)-methyltransferase
VRLNSMALKCLTPHGLLVSASCTSQISPEEFRGMLATAAAESDRHLQILHEAGHALDHPVPAHFPEGRYLKFIVCRT